MTEHPLHPSKLAPKLRKISENEHVPGVCLRERFAK